MKIKATILAGGVFAVVLSVILTGCTSKPDDAKVTPPMPVKVSLPIQRKVTEYSDLTGRTAAIDSIEIRARVWGYIDRFNFKEGMLVRKGEVLFEIDPRTYKAALSQAEGKLASLAARAERIEADYVRYAQLLKTKTV